MTRPEIRRCTGEDHGYCCTDDFTEQPDGTAIHRDDLEDLPFCRRCGHSCAHRPAHRLVQTPEGPVCEDEDFCAKLAT